MTPSLVGLRGDALALLDSWSAPTPVQEALRARYVEYLTGHESGVFREDRPHHVTASTLVMSADGASVLLTLHAKAHRWFQFGGHVEPGDTSLLGAASLAAYVFGSRHRPATRDDRCLAGAQRVAAASRGRPRRRSTTRRRRRSRPRASPAR